MARYKIQSWNPQSPQPAYPGAGRGRGGMHPLPLRTAPPELYKFITPSLQIQNAQAQGVMGTGGTLTLSVGPTGMGTVWYPASAAVATSLGTADTSTCDIYIGPVNTPVAIQGIIPSGNGVLALAIPAMTPGTYVVAVWTGGKSGTTCYLNVTGVLTSLSRVSE
jgi:hypothetical protein